MRIRILNGVGFTALVATLLGGVLSAQAPSTRPGVAELAVAPAALDIHRYPDPGCAELTAELARRRGVDQGRVLVGAGSVALLQTLFQAVGEPGAGGNNKGWNQGGNNQSPVGFFSLFGKVRRPVALIKHLGEIFYPVQKN